MNRRGFLRALVGLPVAVVAGPLAAETIIGMDFGKRGVSDAAWMATFPLNSGYGRIYKTPGWWIELPAVSDEAKAEYRMLRLGKPRAAAVGE